MKQTKETVMKRMTLNGGKAGKAALESANRKATRQTDLNFLQDGDEFEMPQDDESFGSQKFGTNDAYFFMVETQNGPVPVYMSQFAKSARLANEDGSPMLDANNRQMWAYSGGTCYDVYSSEATVSGAYHALQAHAKDKKKKIKVSTRTVHAIVRDFTTNEDYPKDVTLYDFNWL